jgi:hypothetical protein
MNMMSSQYAVYLPAVNSNYAKELLKPLPPNRSFPKNISLKDLIFWDKSNKLWHHNAVLHSIGLHKYPNQVVNAITEMGKTDCLLVGDSGGYQIGKGALKGYVELHKDLTAKDAVNVWRNAYDLKKWIVDYLEMHCDYAMTLDMPLWSKDERNANTPFHNCSVEELTQMTVENLQFIDGHREGRTKWLNVIQGLDDTTTIEWWNAVKWFDCSGYALAGNAGVAGGIDKVLQILLIMYEEGKLTEATEWIHVLGVSTTKWAIFLTAIQRVLRRKLKNEIKVSYDSSSAFRIGGVWEGICTLPTFERRLDTWTIGVQASQQSLKLFNSTEPFPYSFSPLGKLLTWGDLNVKGEQWDWRTFDTVSNLLLVNHNVWTYLHAFEQANQIAFDNGHGEVPQQWANVLELIEGIFDVGNWRSELSKNNKLFEAVK